MNFFNLFVCIFYGVISITQTLNSRFLFRTLQFNFYSTVFLVQRIVIICLNRAMNRKFILDAKVLLYVLPYSFIMCTINILSSYCVTIMPLAAFMAFKKFVVFFILIIGIVMNLPNHFKKIHYYCIGGIVFGGLMIGERDIFGGEIIGYVASLGYTLFQALSLQYSLHLYQQKSIGPQDLIVANSILSLPYYVFMILWEQQYQHILVYFTDSTPPLFYFCLLLTILLSFSSQYTANIISMKISPFQKASVSNIKDLVLTVISIKYFQDFVLTTFSQVGIVFCLASSMIFSFALIEDNPQQKPQLSLKYYEIGREILHHHEQKQSQKLIK